MPTIPLASPTSRFAGRTPTARPPIRRLAFLALAAALAGCATSRPEPAPPRAPVAQADTAGPARVGLAATMDIPENPYGDTAEVAVPTPEDIASGAVPLGNPEGAPETRAMGSYGTGAGGALDPSDVTVSRYYYQDEGTYYYEDVAADLDDYAQGADDEVYYGGYSAGYYRYGDPAYFPSPYRYYRPYATYRPYVRFGWYPTWRHRRAWAHRAYYDPYYAGYGYYDPWAYDPWYGPGVSVSIGWGYGGYGYGGYGYGAGYRDGFYDGYASGYYGPGYYGRPRHRGYNDFRDGYDDGRRSRIRSLARATPAVQSVPDPARQPARRGLAPARLPSAAGPGGITRSTGRTRVPSAVPERVGRRSAAPPRTGRSDAPPARVGRTEAPPSRAGRTDAPARRRAESPPARRAEPSRQAPSPRRESRQAPPRRQESRPAPSPRRESRPAPPPRRESRPAPPPRRESRPAPPRRESRPAPAPRRESRPAPRRGGNERAPSRRRGGNN